MKILVPIGSNDEFGVNEPRCAVIDVTHDMIEMVERRMELAKQAKESDERFLAIQYLDNSCQWVKSLYDTPYLNAEIGDEVIAAPDLELSTEQYAETELNLMIVTDSYITFEAAIKNTETEVYTVELDLETLKCFVTPTESMS